MYCVLGNFDAAKEVIENIEVQAPDNMCVINHKLNLFRRHGLDLTDLYQQYIEHKSLSSESIQLLISKFARYLHKVGKQYFWIMKAPLMGCSIISNINA